MRDDPFANTLLICGASEHYVQCAILLASSKFRLYFPKRRLRLGCRRACYRHVRVRRTSPPACRSTRSHRPQACARLQAAAPRAMSRARVCAPTDIRTPDERARGGGSTGAVVIGKTCVFCEDDGAGAAGSRATRAWKAAGRSLWKTSLL
ncbi:hypothetical protein C8R44DRAFT_863478 [Mycena epipterygia]|nr:hypothetical protein C8R44DRAFT_863478 [Mycena epipterygia]